MDVTAEIAYIETQLTSGHGTELSRAFNLLQQAVDLDLQTQARLAQCLSKYLAEDNKTLHIVAALHCLYVFDDAQPFKTAVLNLGRSKRQAVRLAVASCLSVFGVWDASKEDFFVDGDIVTLTLLLMRDTSPSVRDWAVFQFNNGIANDSAEIRAALHARTKDTNRDVRQEAIVTLTARGETRYVPFIKEKLHRIDVAPIWIEAAAVSHDKSFIADLEELLEKRQQSTNYSEQSISRIEEAITELS
jgi:hypothetical protein